jgi:O-antigen ligase
VYAREWWRPDPVAIDGPAAARPEAAEVANPLAGRMAFRALVAFTVITIVAPQEFIAPLRPLRIALLAATLALVSHVYDRWSGRLTTGRTPVEVWMALGLVTWSIITIPLSFWPGGSVLLLFDLFLKSVAVFVLLAGVVDTRHRLWTISWTLLLCCVPVALTALYNYAAGIYMEGGNNRIAGYGRTGLTGNPNDLALLMNLIIPLGVALFVTSRQLVSRAASGVILLLAMAAVIVTFSRSGFVTLATIGLLYLWRLVRMGRAGLAGLLVAGALVGLMMAPAGYGDRLGTVLDIDSDPTQSAQSRWRDMGVAVQFALSNPIFGAGLGMDVLALNELRGDDWISVHNAYLNFAMDLGLVGLGLYLLLIVTVLVGVQRVEKRRTRGAHQDDLGRLAGAIRISLVAFVVSAFFYPVAYHAYFYYFAGLAVAIRRLDRRVPATAPVPVVQAAA